MPALIENYSDQNMKHHSTKLIEGMDNSGSSESKKSSDKKTKTTTVAPHGPPPDKKHKTGSFSTGGTTVYFFVITTFYVIISYILSGDPDPVKDAKSQAIYFGVYILLVIAGEYYQNIALTKKYCYSAQIKTAGMMTFVPWVTIFGVLMLMIKIFDGWLAPFANTFGYGFAKLKGLNSLMKNKILKPPQDIDDVDLKESLAEILTDPSILFNQIPRDTLTFNSFWSKITPLLRSNADDSKLELRHLVTLKYSVAWYLWYMLGGLLTIAVSINWLMSTGCNQNTKDMMKRHYDYEMCLEGKTEYCPTEEAADITQQNHTTTYASHKQM